jgi:hypothetical protein
MVPSVSADRGIAVGDQCAPYEPEKRLDKRKRAERPKDRPARFRGDRRGFESPLLRFLSSRRPDPRGAFVEAAFLEAAAAIGTEPGGNSTAS